MDNTNNKRYQQRSSFHPIVFEPVQTPDAQPTDSKPLFQHPAVCGEGIQPEPADKKSEVHAEERCSIGNDDHDDKYYSTTWKESENVHQVFNENSKHCQSSTFETTASEAVHLSREPFRPTCGSPLSQCGNSNPPQPADEDCEVEEEPAPDYDDDDDDDDDIFTLWKNKNDDIHHTLNGGWPNGLGNNWRVEGYRQNRKCQLDNMAVNMDDDFPIASSISASGVGDGRDVDDVFALSGNGRHKGSLYVSVATQLLQHENIKIYI